MKHVAVLGLRWLFGLFYAVVDAVALVFWSQGKTLVNPDNNERELAFAAALSATGFMDALIFATCCVGGLLVLIRRTTPLGLAVLAPLIAGIFLYHVFLSKEPVIGNAQLALFLVLVWLHRSAYRPLWNYSRRDDGRLSE